MGTLSCMSFHCFCHRVSGATVIPLLMLTCSLRRESSYALVADDLGASGSTAAATCSITQPYLVMVTASSRPLWMAVQAEHAKVAGKASCIV